MIKRLGFIALLAVTATVGSISAQYTHTINDNCSGNINGWTVKNVGPFMPNGYYNVSLTLYSRNVTGLGPWTKVKYTPKTTTLTGSILNFDGTYSYNSQTVYYDNNTASITWVQRPYLLAQLNYLPTNLRDKEQFCWMKFVGSVYSSRNSGNLVTIYGGFGIRPPYNTDQWGGESYANFSDGRVRSDGVQQWYIP